MGACCGNPVVRSVCDSDDILRDCTCNFGRELTANVVAINSDDAKFPERQRFLTNTMCTSGGGARALTFSLGVFRALADMGIIASLDGLSSVSGGTWASSILMFAEQYHDEQIDTPTLLGAPTVPQELTMKVLDKDPAPLGIGATADAAKFITKSIFCAPATPLEDVWIETCARIYLKPFGLESLDAFMASTQEDVTRIIDANPKLKNKKFFVPRTDRPRTFVMNGTLLAPLGYVADADSACSFQMSPDFTGSPFYPNNDKVTYRHAVSSCLFQRCRCMDLTLLVGGGMVESFAFGGSAPNGKAQRGGEDDIVGYPGTTMSLGRAIGISSDALASTLQQFGSLGRALNPRSPYWPVSSEEFPEHQMARRHEFGDGGLLDNSGLLALLQRGAKRVIWIANSYRGLSTTYDYAKATPETFDPYEAQVIDQLFDKFGYGTSNIAYYYTNNQVFKQDLLLDIVRRLVLLKKEGKPAVVQLKLEVQPNSWWGISGGYEVDIVLIYLDTVSNFETQLPEETQTELKKGIMGAFKSYPIYETSAANLSNSQVNLLAAQGEYCVRQNQSLFRQFLGSA